MIPAKHDRVFESTMPALETADYTFDQSDLRHIAEVLRTMYSDPVGAVVREYSANAVDAHRYAGTPEKAFDLHVPSLDEPYISWRDYGPGLSDEDLKKKLLGYGASGKRGSNLDIGGFGIGAKCGYAVSDQFTFTSYFGGKRTVWHCYLNEDGDSKSDKISCEDSVEPTGIAVNIPVRLDSLQKFEEAIGNAFLFYRTRPNIIGPGHVKTRVNRTLPKPFMHGNFTMTDRSGNEAEIKWEAIKDPDFSDRVSRHDSVSNLAFTRVVMGGVSYPINLESVGGGFENNEGFLRRVVLTAPVGFFKLAPSRESLTYNTSVCGILTKLFNAVLETASSSVEKEIVNPSNTCRRRSDLYGSLISLLGSGTKKLEDMLEAKYWVRGSSYFIMPVDQVRDCVKSTVSFERQERHFSGVGYKAFWHKTSRTPEAGQTVNLPTDANQVIAVEDPKMDDLSLLGASVKQHLFQQTDARFFTIICVKAGELSALRSRCPWLNDGSVPSVNQTDLPKPEKETLDEFTFVKPEVVRSSYSGSRTKYDQHGKKFVKLKSDTHDHGTQSDNWTAVKVRDLPDTRKIYVPIDAFRVQIPYRNRATTSTDSDFKFCLDEKDFESTATNRGVSTSVFRMLINALQKTKTFEELNDGILGIRVADAKSIKDDPEFVYLWDYVKEKMEALIASGVTKESLRVAWDLLNVYDAGLLNSCLVWKSLHWPILDTEFRLRDCQLSRAVVDLYQALQPAREILEPILLPLHLFFQQVTRHNAIEGALHIAGALNANAEWGRNYVSKSGMYERSTKDLHSSIAEVWKQIEKTDLYKALKETLFTQTSETHLWSHGVGMNYDDVWCWSKFKSLSPSLWLQEGRKQTKKEKVE